MVECVFYGRSAVEEVEQAVDDTGRRWSSSEVVQD